MESFDEWYAGAHPRLITSLLLATGDLDLASDCADEAFARALERWAYVGMMQSPSGWAFKVALNHARRTTRRRTLERRLFMKKPKEPAVPAPAGEIWHLVADLPKRQREVVVLRYVGDLGEAEIATALGISRSTVSSSLRDAHNRLGNVLGEPSQDKEHRYV